MTDPAKTIPRTECVLTGEPDLENLYTFKNFPIYVGCVDPSLPNNDLFCDMNWGYSPSSGSVQLLDLLDPNLLYREHHNPGTVGKIWKEHHRKFHDFIDRHGYENVLEIGGASGCLLQHFLSHEKDFTWTIVEPSDQKFTNDSRVHYIPEFFETYKFDKKYNTLVHSHLFEHVYDPIGFLLKVNDLLEDDGKHYITLPNMKHWLEQGYTNTLLFEHTFYVDYEILGYLLNKAGFEVIEQVIEPHSIFICCKKNNNTMAREIQFKHPKKMFNNYVESLEKDLSSILEKIGSSNVYLFGGHIFSQVLLNLGLPESQVINILDNDPGKHEKRLYGSNLIVKSPQCLQGLNDPIVILRGGTYTEEIKESLLAINPLTRII